MTKRPLLVIALLSFGMLPAAVVAQDPPAPAPAAQAPAKPADKPAEQAAAKPGDKPAAQPAVPPATATETLTGWVDVGYRWVAGMNGNENAYRGIVNLGEGPKLFGAALSYRPDKNALLDRLDVQASSWGGEPYNSARVDMHKLGLYDFNFNYRRLDYFSNLPSFANPLAALGSINSQNALDTERRLFDAQIDLFPKSKFSPFFAWSRDAGDGPGLTNFVPNANAPSNEFTTTALYNDAQNVFRGGTHINTNRLNVTLEAGGVRFRDDQQNSYNGPKSFGNVSVPILGISQFITQDGQTYHSSGSSFFSQASVLYRPLSFVDFSGQFSFSQPSVNSTYSEVFAGKLVRLDQLLAYTGETANVAGSALRPHPSGNLALELRPFAKLRVIQSWYIDTFHVTSSALFQQTLTGGTDVFAGTPRADLATIAPDARMLATQYNRYQIEAIYELFERVTLRAGYRGEWADARLSAPNLVLQGDPETGTDRHKMVLSGIELKPRKDLSLSAEGEATIGTSEDFLRVGLPDLSKFKLRLRYKPRHSIVVNAVHSWLSGSNDTPGVNSTFHVRQTSASLMLAPREGKRVSLSLDYMNSVTDSNINAYSNPAFFQTGISRYVLDSHTAGVWCDLALLRGARLNFGGSMLLGDGTRPTNFYQPRALFTVPLNSRAVWTAEWRYYGFHEDLYPAENFNTHLFSVGLRLKIR